VTFIRQGGRAELREVRPSGRALCYFPCQDPVAKPNTECWVRRRPKGAPHPGDGPDWEYSGPSAAPTLHPSVNCRQDKCWHGWMIRDGQLTP
jgi:hypothetical protein